MTDKSAFDKKINIHRQQAGSRFGSHAVRL